MIYIVYDLEATCDDKGGWDNETIEIGAVKISDKGEVIGELDLYIKPITNPILTPFCTRLTGIEQQNVDSGVTFPEAFKELLAWAGEEAIFGSWGYYDRKQFVRDCLRHSIIFPDTFKHISIKHQYASLTNTSPKGMKEVLRREGLELEGRHHNGLADAKNIAKIFIKYLGKWKV